MTATILLAETHRLPWLDWGGMVVYTAAMLALGWYYNRRQRTTEDYFLGGGRMSPLLIGFSLFASLLGPITYLSLPGEVIGKGPGVLSAVLALPIAYLIVGYVLLPLYMRHRVTSAYELLEARLGLGARLLGSGIFIVLRVVWMAILINLTSSALTVMLGLDAYWNLATTTAAGIAAIVYTSFGGLRVAVISDFVQALLMFFGAVFVIGYISVEFGGFNWFPTHWQSTWDVQPLYSFDPKTRVTVLGSIISMTIWSVAIAGGDQTSVQRFMAIVDADAARRAFRIKVVCTVALNLLLGIVGLALLGYFQHESARVPGGLDVSQQADQLFPYFIRTYLPAGVAGLVVMALFAAAMSCFDSGLNSVAAVVQTDYLSRLRATPLTQAQVLVSSKLMTVVIGMIVVGLSTVVHYVPGGYLEVAQKTTHLFITPLFALFFFALFVRSASPTGAVVGVICGVILGGLVAFSGPIFGRDAETGLDPVSFQWTGPVAFVGSVLSGMLVGNVLNLAARFRPVAPVESCRENP